jgi:hypothetical protein
MQNVKCEMEVVIVKMIAIEIKTIYKIELPPVLTGGTKRDK